MSWAEDYRAWLLAPVMAQLTKIQQELIKMADVLDSELTAMSNLAAGQATLLADANLLIADFQAATSGQIALTDPRWATLTNAIATAASNATTLDASIKAVLPAAPPAPATPTA